MAYNRNSLKQHVVSLPVARNLAYIILAKTVQLWTNKTGMGKRKAKHLLQVKLTKDFAGLKLKAEINAPTTRSGEEHSNGLRMYASLR